MAFAARCRYLGEMLDEANAALTENASHFLDHPKDINDRERILNFTPTPPPTERVGP